MKLLFVHENLGEFGGAEAYVELTATGLRQRGHAVGLLYQKATGRNEQKWRETFESCFCVPDAANSEWLEAVLESFEPDLIFVHNWAELGLLERLLASGVPLARMVHDHALYCLRTYKYNYFTRKNCLRPASGHCIFPCLASVVRDRTGKFGLKWASLSKKRQEIQLNQQCAAFFTYSNYQKEELARNGFDRSKIFVSSPLRATNPEGMVSSFSGRNLILFVGQIIRGKGVDVLLESLAKLTVDFECVVVGDGSHRDYCQRLCARLGLAHRVRFEGYVLPAELKKYYLEASVFAMSSLWPEPFGMAGPEAMRYGLPVVAFNAGAIKEWLRDSENGFLVPWKNTELFAARLEQLLRDKQLARHLGRNGLRSVQRFEADAQIDWLEQVLASLCSENSRPGREPVEFSKNAICL